MCGDRHVARRQTRTPAPHRRQGPHSGLSDALVEKFGAQYPELAEAVDEAVKLHAQLRSEFPDILDADETTQMARVQADFINFYPDDAVNPYVALAARGPWVITLKGAVIHDSGGYGMLGLGHTPKAVLEALGRPQVMANVMTPSISHLRFTRALEANVGLNRKDKPFKKFLCLNSGSESVSLASRIADVNAKLMTEPGAKYAGRTIKRIAVKGAFHGRTERPAVFSDSSRKAYVQHLASFRDEHSLITVEPYNVEHLRQIFADADRNGWFIEAMFLEPIMGEGDPGRAATPEFYAAARELTKAHGSIFLVDSIQAGLRGHGVLSIVDYPGFEKFEAPDMETYSKALNAGQYPLSVLAVSERAANLYKKGIYGNTMSSNPRAMDVAVAVLEQMTPARAREHHPPRQGIHRQTQCAEKRIAGPDHESPGNRSAVLVRTRRAVQMLWRGQHRRMDARARHRRDPRRHQFAALHAALQHHRRGSRSGRRRCASGAAARPAHGAGHRFEQAGRRRLILALLNGALRNVRVVEQSLSASCLLPRQRAGVDCARSAPPTGAEPDFNLKEIAR